MHNLNAVGFDFLGEKLRGAPIVEVKAIVTVEKTHCRFVKA